MVERIVNLTRSIPASLENWEKIFEKRLTIEL